MGELRDTGVEDDDLKAMGADLDSGHSALVASVDVEDIDKAKRLLAEVDAVNVAVKEVDADIATALDEEAAAAGEAPAS